jgi:hypothetical protein
MTAWRVIRIDDNGFSTVMVQGLSRAEAESVVEIMESRGHHQTYVAEEYQ